MSAVHPGDGTTGLREPLSSGLFRQEALENYRTRIWGEATLKLEASFAIITAFLVASIAAAAIFLASGTYARKETAKGFVVSTAGIAKIMPSRGGVVVGMHVAEGDIVDKNAPLLTISEERATDRGEGIDAAALASLRQQQARLREQITLEQRKADTGRQRLIDDISGLAKELAALDQQQRVQIGRTELARQQVAQIVELVKTGTMSRLELQRREDAHLSQQQHQADISARIASKQADFLSRRNALEQLPIETAQRIAALDGSVAETDIKLKETDGGARILCGRRSPAGFRRCRPGSAKAPSRTSRSSRSFRKAASSGLSFWFLRARSGSSRRASPCG
jgi:membrane fusion protein